MTCRLVEVTVIVVSVSGSGVGTTTMVEGSEAMTTEASEGGGPLSQEVVLLVTMNGKTSCVVVDCSLAGGFEAVLQKTETDAVIVVGT